MSALEETCWMAVKSPFFWLAYAVSAATAPYVPGILDNACAMACLLVAFRAGVREVRR